ncbi:TetR/AcrR family transcriptional regulator [Rhodococcus sp. BP-252]|uniref:TetR/AcrR family transcriptional regulator n=1 Tax=unclassified Rhodococcus (in: high G+C Gram-positive bacteria) TaxID=192944 RepID=UPI0014320B37|nr:MULTISPECIES: TetR/AcrR family transcriptional regulator [unclassified Rhodococcus (in: high G+C Gram-positive bacteria)]MBY6411761.1 TetR/AcrR family transcriptional regulator [Rhodococcus sp. BP-320]MBY6417254.1 TetR/AcrR family transcriptional regulator [Rhodococcus sp. BP-321]MBY6421961.1 TetR/AcrR family transcriptional regulator [Rhodococcus sp. BP-324]MBY6427278.1 TetR/AcrR family transcriptional regulator [Rhodococcus sp. BP-323]MBY6432579.1 TetR/AcrR family transcriptional regulato
MVTAREPKQDRSRATRQRLLEATIDSLSEHGWAATTVGVVAERAGVSRGATQHHFPTREDLITAALDSMFDTRMENAQAETTPVPPGPERTQAVVERLVEYYTGPQFKAALQVWTAAAADPEMRARVLPLEEKFGRVAHRMAVAHLGADDSDPQTHRLVQATLDLARGLGLADVLSDDSRRRAEIVRAWAGVLDSSLKIRQGEIAVLNG